MKASRETRKGQQKDGFGKPGKWTKNQGLKKGLMKKKELKYIKETSLKVKEFRMWMTSSPKNSSIDFLCLTLLENKKNLLFIIFN